MLAITLNPGFVLIAAAALVLAAPVALRTPTMVAAALLAIWMLLSPEFGAYDAFAQIGMTVVPFVLDETNSVFGLAFLGATIFLAIYAGARANRYECAAVMLLAGASVATLFAGDLISFFAGASLAGLAAAWVVFASDRPGAGAAGVRLLMWHGLEGLLYLSGVSIHVSAAAGGAPLERLDPAALGPALIFAAVMLRVGAPLAHVWLKDAIAHATGTGAAALSAFSSMVGVYVLARMFPGEPLLAPIGAAMILLGMLYAAAQDDLREAGAYALTLQTGVCVVMIGLGGPLALSAAAAHAFTCVFAFALLQMALGAVALRLGEARASALAGVGRRMPMAGLFSLIGALGVCGAPGLAGYASLALALEAAAEWESRFLWAIIAAGAASLFAVLFARLAIVLYAKSPTRAARNDAPFEMILGMSLAAFLGLAVGLAPAWLYSLTPATALSFQAFAPDRLGPILQLAGGSAALYALARGLKLAPPDARVRLLDADSFYRGPLSQAGRWLGARILRGLEGARSPMRWIALKGRAAAADLFSSADRPYARPAGPAAALAAAAMLLVLVLLALH